MIIRIIRGALLSAVASAFSAAPAASELPPEEQSTIVITGQRNAEKDMQDFVRALTPATVGGQLSRFERSICPIVTGLPQQQREAVADRMRRVAQAAGIRTGGNSCVPNVVVVVTQDKNVFVQALRRTHSDYFGTLSKRSISALARQPGPAVAWQLEGPPVNARGVEMDIDPSLGVYMNRTIDPASRLEQPARPQFDGAVVIVERKSLDGLTVTQLGDYAAMRAYAGMDTTRLTKSGTPSILRVLEAPMGSTVVASLTAWDLGFLRGLYAAPRNLRAAAQRSAIGKSMARDVARRR